MRNLYLLLVGSALFVGCGNSSRYIEDNISTTSTLSEDNTSLETVEVIEEVESRVAYSHANFNTLCRENYVFSIYPSLKDIEVQVLDYIPSVHSLGESELSVNIYQMSNPNNTQELTYNDTKKAFSLECMPIIYQKPTDLYLPFKIEIKDRSGEKDTLEQFVTLYDSNEMNCASCHSTDTFENAKPLSGWEDINNKLNSKINILRLHDDKFGDKTSQYIIKTQLEGYSSLGLEESSKNRVVNCSDCHHVMGIEASGAKTITPFTSAIHKTHLNLIDPFMAKMSSCVTCHPADTIKPMFLDNIMHKRGLDWVSSHKDITATVDVQNCKLCHGYNYGGSELSKVTTEFQYKSISYKVGDKVSCLNCHNSTTDWEDMKNLD